MVANVESMFSVREVPWHGLGYIAERNPESVDEALTWAGANWEPVGVPVFAAKESHKCQSTSGCERLAVSAVTHNGTTAYACGRHSMAARENTRGEAVVQPLSLKQLGNYYAVLRSDNGMPLHVAKDTYELFGNRETAELVQLLLDPEEGKHGLKVKFQTGGVLDEGRKVWFLARIEDAYEVPGYGSPIYPHVSALNAHDGTAALRAINTSMCIVCQNTWSAAELEGERTGRTFTFRHTRSIRDRIEDARQVLFSAKADTERWVEYATRMVAVPITDEQVRKFLAEFVPMPPVVTDRVADNVHEARRAIQRFYEGPAVAGMGVHGTAWGLVQATGEYLDHQRTWRSRETYVARTMLRSEPAKHKALKLIEELVAA